MELFTRLFTELNSTNRTNDKVAALERYFRAAPTEDAAWALQFLIGKRPARAVTTTQLRSWTSAEAQLPAWLVDECYTAVGDFGETLALLLPAVAAEQPAPKLHALVRERLFPLASLSDVSKHELIRRTWRELPDSRQRFLWHKLIGGSFRIGVARTLVERALANVAGLPPGVMAHRLMGDLAPTAEAFQQLLNPEAPDGDPGRPYPFYLAHPLEGAPEELGDIAQWQIEPKWDGIRAQLIRRGGQTLLWSRGEELANDAFPEIIVSGKVLPDGTVLDGEIAAWRDDAPVPFTALQQRLGRKSPGEKLQREIPVTFIAYDLLETEGRDVRSLPLNERHALLQSVIAQAGIAFSKSRTASTITAPIQGELFAASESESDSAEGQLRLRSSPVLQPASWEELAEIVGLSRERGVEGVMLKRRDSVYGVGREKGAWWKWKVAPLTVDAVLIAAQVGHGKRAGLFTDYTFALWDAGKLVPVAKAYSGLTDAEIREVDRFVREHTLEKHGPVRTVEAKLVFEIAFEAVQISSRHKSGVAVRFPRILRQRTDKLVAEADQLDTLKRLAR